MQSKTFEEMGIPAGFGFRNLLYCASADALIVQAQLRQGQGPFRLFARLAGSEQYEPVGAFQESISQEDPTVLCSRPLLAYNTLRHSIESSEAGNGWPGNN